MFWLDHEDLLRNPFITIKNRVDEGRNAGWEGAWTPRQKPQPPHPQPRGGKVIKKFELLPPPSLCLSGGWRKDYIMARAGNHRDDQEPVSSPLATAAPDCSLPQRQLALSHPSLHLPTPGKAQTLDISSWSSFCQNLKRLDLSNNKLRSLPAEIGDLHRSTFKILHSLKVSDQIYL